MTSPKTTLPDPPGCRPPVLCGLRRPGAPGHLHSVPPADDLVFVAGDFKALPGAFHTHHRHIGEADLVGGGEDGHLGLS